MHYLVKPAGEERNPVFKRREERNGQSHPQLYGTEDLRQKNTDRPNATTCYHNRKCDSIKKEEIKFWAIQVRDFKEKT